LNIGLRSLGGDWTFSPWAESGSIAREDMVKSASNNAGPAGAAVTIKTNPAVRKYPHPPIAAAARPLPMEAQRLAVSAVAFVAMPVFPRRELRAGTGHGGNQPRIGRARGNR
jgi:hypothetical protein